MTILEFTDTLQTQMKQQADQIRSTHPESLTFAARMIPLVQDLIHDLQQFSYRYTFSDQLEEIKFFKESKPVLTSHYYYYKAEYSLCLFDSFKDSEARKKYYEGLLVKMERYARKNNEFYLYCMGGQTHFDDVYFTRKRTSFRGLIDQNFSTGYDDRLAKLLANELLKSTIQHRLTALDRPAGKPFDLNWTGKKSDAIELLVALHASGRINNGDIDVKKLVKAFEEMFNIRIDNHYDFIQKIRMRKGKQANFLDDLKSKFLLRLERMDD
ncbi:RteC domain-containing protein [Chryseolinea lacunae]|uniref:RteC domain-containing protein n=1 Tax=Chryseolinea lacunae TaxID=2801331 RepID=A0ABS1KZG0_9BACT|nr:RteC domain-containing protein [Chryseolinea lacunae]MBL0744856.1 RteC domain-containing protein [Chryseolinea lacunae]